MDQMFSLRRFFSVVLAIFALTALISCQATQSDFSGRWVKPRPDVQGAQYLDLRADGTYHLRSEWVTGQGIRGVTAHAGTWKIVDGERKVILLSGGTRDGSQDPNDRVNGGQENLNEWTHE